MRLKDIISTGLLPPFAQDSAWMQAALDAWVRSAVGRFDALGASFTLESIQALTDAELQKLYELYDIVQYYPDLKRETRNLFIYNISKLRRRLGTKAAVVALVQYVFDNLDLSVEIFDNLAFDASGTLIDQSLIDLYDVEITLSDAVLTDEIRKRLLDNIFRLIPDRLGLRNITYSYPAYCVQPRQIVVANLETVVENDAVCEPFAAPVLYYLRVGRKAAQYVTSETISVQWGYYYPLYTDASRTEYLFLDRNKSYQMGDYIDGVWVPTPTGDGVVNQEKFSEFWTSTSNFGYFLYVPAADIYAGVLCVWYVSKINGAYSPSYNEQYILIR